jgi:pSer/pThr/pTyr-binding forkhead associated (FHA) protein
MKGQIHELDQSEIHIGRHPDCQVQFPKDLTAVSRRHAQIIREGNRFKLIDQSTNGSFVNGQRVTESYLKDGDVITLSESGPKLSFLTITDSAAPQPEAVMPAPQVQQPTHPHTPPPQIPKAPPTPRVKQTPPPPAAPPRMPPPSSAPQAVAQVKAPLAIQFGPALKSFQSLPVTLGNGPGSDFNINHPEVAQRHAQIFFGDGRYWIKDLTGSGKISLNGLPIEIQAPLEPEMQIALGPNGPRFRFMAGGRLAEIETPPPAKSAETSPPIAKEKPAEAPKSSKPGMFKKFFT